MKRGREKRCELVETRMKEDVRERKWQRDEELDRNVGECREKKYNTEQRSWSEQLKPQSDTNTDYSP